MGVPSGEPFTCQAARPLEGGRGIQLLRVLAVRLGRVDQALGGRQGGVRADGGAQLVDGRGGDGGLHGGGRGHADRGQAGRGHDDVDGRAGAVGLGQAAGRLLGRGAARRRGVGGALGGRASALQLGGRAALGRGQRGAPARGRGQRGARVVERGGGGGLRVGQVEGAAQAGCERLPRRRRRRRRRGLRPRQVPRAAGGALCAGEQRTRALSQREAEGASLRAPNRPAPATPGAARGARDPGSRAARRGGCGGPGGDAGAPAAAREGSSSPPTHKKEEKTGEQRAADQGMGWGTPSDKWDKDAAYTSQRFLEGQRHRILVPGSFEKATQQVT